MPTSNKSRRMNNHFRPSVSVSYILLIFIRHSNMFCLNMKKISVAITILVLTRLLCIQGEIIIANADSMLPSGKLGNWLSILALLCLESFYSFSTRYNHI